MTPPPPRTVTEIVYGCVFTLILGLSYSIRPNISSPTTSTLRVIMRKLRIMFWMLITPELIVAWAFNQWLEGNKIARRYTARGWTSYHGQFFAMGGFLLYKDGRPFQVLSPEMFANLLDASCIEFPSASREELREKSMAHPLLAAITFLQTLWFIVQCITRRVQGFAITQLEMVTLSFVVMIGFLLLFWWNKPLDPCTFIRVDLIRAPPPSNPNLPPDGDVQARINLDFSRERTSGKQLKTIFRTEALFLAKRRRKSAIRTWICSPLKLLEIIIMDYGELFLLNEHVISEGSTGVHIFYAPDTIENLGGFIFTFQNVLGSLFAAAHISMWYGHFPTYRDMMVWQIASLTTVALPMVYVVGLVFLVAFYLVSLLLTVRSAGLLLQAIQVIAGTGVFLGFVAMLVARMALMVEAFVCVTSAYGTTLQAVAWTKYIPHFS